METVVIDRKMTNSVPDQQPREESLKVNGENLRAAMMTKKQRTQRTPSLPVEVVKSTKEAKAKEVAVAARAPWSMMMTTSQPCDDGQLN